MLVESLSVFGKMATKSLGGSRMGVQFRLPGLNSLCVILSLLLWGSQLAISAQNIQDQTIPLTATVSEIPARIVLNWTAPTSGSYTITSQKIYRRKHGAGWGSVYANPSTSALNFTDTSVQVGQRYEYRIVRQFSNGPGSSHGYLETGIRLPVVDKRGSVILLIKDTAAAAMPNELSRLQQDLAGDGWQVIREVISSSASVSDVKSIIAGLYNAPAISDVRSVFLFGSIPVPYSGNLNPDDHADHKGAWPADVYYADVDGVWTDNVVNNVSAADIRNDNIPGDGKFDQSEVPGAVELEIGRVDLSKMTLFPDGSVDENGLLIRYLDRDHNYRNRKGAFDSIPRRGLVDSNFGYYDGESLPSTAWWSFSSFFGSLNIVEADWFSTLDANSYLWAYGGGPGSYTSASGIGSSFSFGNNDSKAVFCMLVGSYFGDWDYTNAFLRAPLAGTENGLGLASMWVGRPHWHLHSMAMGETLGHGTRRTQNNSSDYRSGDFPKSVHLALMGDPTLRLFPVKPVSGLSQISAENKVGLSWSASSDSNIQGYAIYRGDENADQTGIFSRVGSGLTTVTSYDDLSAASGVNYTYMVRAVKLETSASGTYLNSSQGVFVVATYIATPSPKITVTGNSQSIADGSTGTSTGNHTAFGNAIINSETVSRTYTIRNDGDATLSLSGSPLIQLTGSHASDFTVTSQPGKISLSPNELTTFVVRFRPTALGTRNAVVTLTSNDSIEGTYSYAVSGEGEPVPEITVTGNSQSIVDGSSGTSLANHTDFGSGVFNDYTLSRSYTIRNDGDATLVLSGSPLVQLSGSQVSDFTVTSQPGKSSLASGESTTFDIRFAASALGLREALVTLDSNDTDEGTFTFAISGTGNPVAPSPDVAVFGNDVSISDGSNMPSSSNHTNFGAAIIGDDSVNRTYTIRNDGNLTLSLTGSPIVQLSGSDMSDFSVISQPLQNILSATESVTFVVRFTPSAVGVRNAQVTFSSDDEDEGSFSFAISGEGNPVPPAPEIDLFGNELPIQNGSMLTRLSDHTDFGEFLTDRPVEVRTYTIYNSGDADLDLENPTVTGTGFSISALTSGLLAPGASLEFKVSFAAGLPAGDYSATVNIASSDLDESSFSFRVSAKNLNPLEAWRLNTFGESSDSGDGANGADANRDGITNLMAFALGLDPFENNIFPTDGVSPGLPAIVSDAVSIKYRYLIPSNRDGLLYTVEVSKDLEFWMQIVSVSTGQSGECEINEASGPENFQLCFFRLSVQEK